MTELGEAPPCELCANPTSSWEVGLCDQCEARIRAADPKEKTPMTVGIAKAERCDRWDPDPLTWWPATSDGRRTAIVACKNKHAMPITNHSIAKDGTVSPSVVCPSCDWHVHIKLEGWKP